MTRRLLLALLALLGLAGSAAAAPKVQLLQSDGRADAAVRAKIDAAVRALAKSGGEKVIPGDITFTDAAAAVGCKPDDAACKDEVIGMLSVDEIVITTVTPKPGGFEVAVRRVGKGGASREAIAFVPADKLDKLDGIAPLFSARPAAAPAPAPAPGPMIGPRLPPPAPPAPEPAPAPPPVAITTRSAAPEIAPGARGGPPAVTAPIAGPVSGPIRPRGSEPSPARRADRPGGKRRLPLVGMAAGGTMVVAGLAFWAAAAGVQRDIDAAPVGTKAQLLALQDLESRGDAYATAGNVLVFSGLVLGGISTYYFVKRGRRRASSARVVPMLRPAIWRGGGGLAFAIGGTP